MKIGHEYNWVHKEKFFPMGKLVKMDTAGLLYWSNGKVTLEDPRFVEVKTPGFFGHLLKKKI